MLELSLVLATYNRGPSLRRLLDLLAHQTLSPDKFEVIVIDDGSATPAEEVLAGFTPPYAFTLRRQANTGAAVARHNGALIARGEVIVFTDDDMRIPDHFLAAHLRLHPEGTRRFVLGRIIPDTELAMPLFERYHAEMLERFQEEVKSGVRKPHGSDVCSGDVSMRRVDYLAVGGFDATLKRSEDAELGIRLERAGVEPVVSEEAFVIHGSDHTSQQKWLDRSLGYGRVDLHIARKHAGMASAHPLRFLSMVNLVSRPLLTAALLAPRLTQPLVSLTMAVANGLDKLGAEQVAISGATLVHGLQYYRGMGLELGSKAALAREAASFYFSSSREPAFAEMVAAVRADYATMHHYDAKYHQTIGPRSQLGSDAVQKIGFQMLIAYRLMRFFRASGRPLLAKMTSRLMRHLYGADIHWDADIAPGVMIVHGMGLVIGHSARIGAGCILFQHVTIGEGSDPQTRKMGSPVIGPEVHIGPGASVIGPITVGARTKITGGALLMRSVEEDSLVETPPPQVTARKKRVS